MEIAKGSNRDFSHSLETTAAPVAIWSLWTTPSTWALWDLGLKSAELDGPFVEGAVGTIISKSGPASEFKVLHVEAGKRCTFGTRLPLARLEIDRFLEPSPNEKVRITHHVSFSGVLAGFWAMLFGPGFRRDLPPTMARLAALADEEVASK
jgi:hypothetical protein